MCGRSTAATITVTPTTPRSLSRAGGEDREAWLVGASSPDKAARKVGDDGRYVARDRREGVIAIHQDVDLYAALLDTGGRVTTRRGTDVPCGRRWLRGR